MSNAKPTRARASQRGPLRAADDAAILLGTALVGGRRYDVVATQDGATAVVVPGVAGTDEVDALPERRVPFRGAAVCVEVSLKQGNSFVGAADMVGCLTGWSIALDGVVVYGRMRAGGDASAALVEAASVLPRLLALPIRPQERDDWLGLAVRLDGGPATVVGLRGAFGELILEAADGGEVAVDLLSDRIFWTGLPASETSPHG